MLFAKMSRLCLRQVYVFVLQLCGAVLAAFLCCNLAGAQPAMAVVDHPGIYYSNAINSSSWRYSGTEFECRLAHRVPFFGDVVFRKRAGESSAFFMDAREARFAAGEVHIVAQPPAWGKGAKISMAEVKLKRGKRPLWLGTKETEQMLAQLLGGREIFIAQKAWFTVKHSEPARLEISNIGFRAVYRQYLNCLSSLLPANFDQLRRSALYFQTAVSEPLTAKAITTLENIILLVSKDKSIQKFFVDGHASSTGTRSDNLLLSKDRAELVSNYLKSNGVPAEQIITRWHGERYPVASNNTAKGRAKNRRVTVRLEKVDKAMDQKEQKMQSLKHEGGAGE
ncbi:MAG: OmpA family protein [Cellvibrionaceae bacterium]|nr:OmpA family protein [Cellvibrionaceae bacterium]